MGVQRHRDPAFFHQHHLDNDWLVKLEAHFRRDGVDNLTSSVNGQINAVDHSASAFTSKYYSTSRTTSPKPMAFVWMCPSPPPTVLPPGSRAVVLKWKSLAN